MISTEYKKMLLNLVVTFIGSFFAVTLAFYLHTPPSSVGIPIPPSDGLQQTHAPGEFSHPMPGPGTGTFAPGPKAVKALKKSEKRVIPPQAPIGPQVATPAGPQGVSPEQKP